MDEHMILALYTLLVQEISMFKKCCSAMGRKEGVGLTATKRIFRVM